MELAGTLPQNAGLLSSLEEPLPARPSPLPYRHVPREGEAGPQQSGSHGEEGAPTAASPDQGQTEINLQIKPTTLVASTSPKVAGSGGSNCERVQNLSEGQKFPNLGCSDRRRNQVAQEGLQQSLSTAAAHLSLCFVLQLCSTNQA